MTEHVRSQVSDIWCDFCAAHETVTTVVRKADGYRGPYGWGRLDGWITESPKQLVALDSEARCREPLDVCAACVKDFRGWLKDARAVIDADKGPRGLDTGKRWRAGEPTVKDPE